MKDIPVVGAILLLVGLFSGAALATPSDELEISKCVLEMPGSNVTAEAECGWLSVAENPAEPEGRQIRLRFALARALKESEGNTPVFFFAGGPGQAASELWVQLEEAFRKIRRNHDIVLLDQRGTGRDSPLRCELDYQTIEFEINLGKITEQIRECLGKFEGDPRFYTTTIAMADYDLLREKLGYEQINLVGVSYGTRAAQEYLRRYPQRVRTITLDSVVPVELALGAEHARNLDAAMALVLDDCLADTTCSEAFPDIKKNLRELIETTRSNPQTIVVDDPLSGEPIELEASMDLVAVALRMLAYADTSQSQLPFLIHDAVSNNNPRRLVSQALMVLSGLQEMLASGMEAAVICSEDYPRIRPNPADARTILGESMYKVLVARCEIWPRGEVPEDFNQPFRSDVPALLLSGEFDPVTPPRYADQAARQYSNHLNLVIKGQGHSVGFSHCTSEILRRFIDTASVEDLEIECLESQGRAPFFVNLLGPTP